MGHADNINDKMRKVLAVLIVAMLMIEPASALSLEVRAASDSGGSSGGSGDSSSVPVAAVATTRTTLRRMKDRRHRFLSPGVMQRIRKRMVSLLVVRSLLVSLSVLLLPR